MSQAKKTETISCPECGHTLPGVAQKCHFCGANVRGLSKIEVEAKPVSDIPFTNTNFAEQRNLVAYYVMAAFWLANGSVITMASSGVMTSLLAGPGALASGNPALGAVIGVIIGVLYALVGLGLLAGVRVARNAVAIMSWAAIGLGVLTFAFKPGSGQMGDPEFVVPTLMNFLQIGCGAFQLYLLRQTDKYM